MKTAADTAWIVERARELGFALCGVAPLKKFAEHEAFAEWLARGYAGEMAYLADARRESPEQVLKGAGNVIVCALNYNTAHPYSSEVEAQLTEARKKDSPGPRGWISRYAWGRDYHEVMWEGLNALLQLLKEKFPEKHFSRAYADTGPIAERIFAKHAGLGWLGKNTLLLNEKWGSWLFLGVIVTSLDLAPSLAPGELPPADLCGNCRQCLDACPTEALIEPYVLDARRCISYLTIELRGSVPEEYREAMGKHVYGCDVCQEVCPYNRDAPITEVEEFEPRTWEEGKSLFAPRLEWLAGMTEEEFREKFRRSAMKRTKWRGLVRNACMAIGNAELRRGSAEHGRIVKLLDRLGGSPETVIGESARWALSRIR
jgi:epoxyqueuosine reductase